jgi:thiol-disulfide isomerase/thioredoxin
MGRQDFDQQIIIQQISSMKTNKNFFRKIPGWAITAALFGVLYLTGLHTEAIGQVQRILLATGAFNAGIPGSGSPGSVDPATPAATSGEEIAGSGLRMVNLAGQPVSLESLKGKVIFLNIWATWCAPCIAEMPNIQNLYKKVGSDKIAFVMLSVDQGGLDKVKKFIDRKGFTFPVYLAAGELPLEFDTGALPTTYIISPAGNIVKTQEGMAEYDTPAFRKYLEGLAK